jgi:hypothetical protein
MRESKDIPVIANLIPDECLVAPWIESIKAWKGLCLQKSRPDQDCRIP